MSDLVAAVLTGLTLGAVGSGHCLAMCGPLVLLSTPRNRVADSAAMLHAALYHGGRVLMYVALGAVAGLAGALFVRAGLGRALAVAAGAVLVLQALAFVPRVASVVGTLRFGQLLTRGVLAAAAWMRRHRLRGPLVIGALNGLLPCGLLYAALSSAVGLGDTQLAVAFMAAFGLGTTPVLAALAMADGTVAPRLPARVRRMAPIALALIGVLLILRGVSPSPVAHAIGPDPEGAAPPIRHHSRGIKH